MEKIANQNQFKSLIKWIIFAVVVAIAISAYLHRGEIVSGFNDGLNAAH